jgi:hypothetical protein
MLLETIESDLAKAPKLQFINHGPSVPSPLARDGRGLGCAQGRRRAGGVRITDSVSRIWTKFAEKRIKVAPGSVDRGE